MSGISPSARFVPVSSKVNAALAIAVEPKLPGQVLSATYSFLDQSGLFNPVADAIQSRLAIIAGRFGDALANFTVAYNLNGYRVLLDHAINDVGPTALLIPPDAEDGVSIETDGVTVLLAAPIVVGVTGTLFVGKLAVTSRGLVTQTRDARRAMENAAGNAAPAAPAPSSSTTTSSGSGSGTSTPTSTSSGISAGGGTTGGGGGVRIRPL